MGKIIRYPTKAEFAEALGYPAERFDYIDLNSISMHGLADLLGLFSEDSFSRKEQWDSFIHRKDGKVLCVCMDFGGTISAIRLDNNSEDDITTEILCIAKKAINQFKQGAHFIEPAAFKPLTGEQIYNFYYEFLGVEVYSVNEGELQYRVRIDLEREFIYDEAADCFNLNDGSIFTKESNKVKQAYYKGLEFIYKPMEA